MSQRPNPEIERRVRLALERATDFVQVPTDFARELFAEVDERRGTLAKYEAAVDRAVARMDAAAETRRRAGADALYPEFEEEAA
jgi:hypothetical protein